MIKKSGVSDRFWGLGQCRVSGGIGALAVFIFLLMKGIHNIFAANPRHKAIHPCAELSTQHKMLGLSQEFEVTQTGPFLCSWEHHLCREQIMDSEKLKQHIVLFRCQPENCYSVLWNKMSAGWRTHQWRNKDLD